MLERGLGILSVFVLVEERGACALVISCQLQNNGCLNTDGRHINLKLQIEFVRVIIQCFSFVVLKMVLKGTAYIHNLPQVLIEICLTVACNPRPMPRNLYMHLVSLRHYSE